MSRSRNLALIALLTSSWDAPVLSSSLPDCAAPKAIRFECGASSGAVTGSVLRGEDVCYKIVAKARQTLSATVTSPDDNLEFQVFRPGYRTTRDADAASLAGATLVGAGPDDDARHMALTLPTSGIYAVLLGTERGGRGTYRLKISLQH